MFDCRIVQIDRNEEGEGLLRKVPNCYPYRNPSYLAAMRTTLLFGLILILAACSEEAINDRENEMDDLSIGRLRDCYYHENSALNEAKTLIIDLLGDEIYSKHVRFDPTESSINCSNENTIELLPFGDTTCCNPSSYDLRYQLMMGNEELFSFRLLGGKDREFEVASTIVQEQLDAYRKLLEGKFDISFAQAKKIALKHGANLSESVLELVLNENNTDPNSASHYWEIELDSDDNSVVLLQIDAMTGKTTTSRLSL